MELISSPALKDMFLCFSATFILLLIVVIVIVVIIRVNIITNKYD